MRSGEDWSDDKLEEEDYAKEEGEANGEGPYVGDEREEHEEQPCRFRATHGEGPYVGDDDKLEE